MIKLSKRCFYDVIGPGELDDEQLGTAFTVVEGLLNSRPLARVSSDPNDEEVLTPAHFMSRSPYKDIAVGPETDDLRQRYLYLQSLMNKYWERFMKEIVPLKNRYNKDVKKGVEFKEGDLVVLLDPLDRQKGFPVAKVVEAVLL